MLRLIIGFVKIHGICTMIKEEAQAAWKMITDEYSAERNEKNKLRNELKDYKEKHRRIFF